MPSPVVSRTRVDALCDHSVAQLSTADLNVLQTQKLSCGVAGLALGQTWGAEQSLAVGLNAK